MTDWNSHKGRHIDFDGYRNEAMRLRAEYVSGRLADRKSPGIMSRRVSLALTAFALATAAFWATMLTSPPTTEASGTVSYGVQELMRNAPLDLPSLDADGN